MQSSRPVTISLLYTTTDWALLGILELLEVQLSNPQPHFYLISFISQDSCHISWSRHFFLIPLKWHSNPNLQPRIKLGPCP